MDRRAGSAAVAVGLTERSTDQGARDGEKDGSPHSGGHGEAGAALASATEGPSVQKAGERSHNAADDRPLLPLSRSDRLLDAIALLEKRGAKRRARRGREQNRRSRSGTRRLSDRESGAGGQAG